MRTFVSIGIAILVFCLLLVLHMPVWMSCSALIIMLFALRNLFDGLTP